MFKIKERFRNKAFLTIFISTLVLLIKQLGFDFVPENLSDVVDTILVLLAMVGIVLDPTTPGLTDKK